MRHNKTEEFLPSGRVGFTASAGYVFAMLIPGQQLCMLMWLIGGAIILP
jgi:hypothetical protein